MRNDSTAADDCSGRNASGRREPRCAARSGCWARLKYTGGMTSRTGGLNLPATTLGVTVAQLSAKLQHEPRTGAARNRRSTQLAANASASRTSSAIVERFRPPAAVDAGPARAPRRAAAAPAPGTPSSAFASVFRRRVKIACASRSKTPRSSRAAGRRRGTGAGRPPTAPSAPAETRRAAARAAARRPRACLIRTLRTPYSFVPGGAISRSATSRCSITVASISGQPVVDTARSA